MVLDTGVSWGRQSPGLSQTVHITAVKARLVTMEAPQTPPPFDVLVTGSAGHLGTALMLTLPTLGFTPLGIDILPSQTTHIVGSISNRDFVFSITTSHSTIQHIIHAATLHKPHVESHAAQDFIDTNITGTLALLEAAATLPDLKSFIFMSTTSAFGTVLSPAPGNPATWIDETVTPQPKNIYGVTKTAAEDLCFLAHKKSNLPVLVLRTSRFFPEEDDDEDRRNAMTDDNLKVLELAYRRVDMADIVSACHCGMQRAEELRWGRFIISAPPPFSRDVQTLTGLNEHPQAVFAQVVPGVEGVFKEKGWKFLSRLDRVYDSSKAVRELGWRPAYTFQRTVERIRMGEEWRSQLAIRVGKKGYHAVTTGVYTKR